MSQLCRQQAVSRNLVCLLILYCIISIRIDDGVPLKMKINKSL